MATEQATETEVERESAERIARVHRALAAAQDRYYWLDRWGIDLNAVMRRRGAREARALYSGVRAVFRIAREMRERNERARAGRPLGQDNAAPAGPAHYADVVVDALGESGMRLREGLRGLDLGGSPEGLTRILTAAFPGLEVTTETNAEPPPLDHGDESFDFACAISPWDESSAAGWLRELRRVIRPDGRLLLTAHSPFLTPEWVLTRTSPDWAVVLYRPRHVLGRQDLYVLEPR